MQRRSIEGIIESITKLSEMGYSRYKTFYLVELAKLQAQRGINLTSKGTPRLTIPHKDTLSREEWVKLNLIYTDAIFNCDKENFKK